MKVKILFLFVLSIQFLYSQTYHTITIDGNNDFNAGETFNTSSSGYIAYVTWDVDNLYLGYSGNDIGTGQATTKWIVFYFDKDANLNPISGAGSSNAIGFNTQNWNLPFRADYMLQIRTTGGADILKHYNGTNWVDVVPSNLQVFDNNSTNYIEIRLPRASIGNPTKIYMVAYFIQELPNNEWTYASFPDNSLRGGDGYKNPGFFDNWYGFELTTGIIPNSQLNYNNREFLKWDIKLSALISSSSVSDLNNFVGVGLNTTDGFDEGVDLPKPPMPPSNYVYLTFPHPEWNHPLGPNFYRDIRQNVPLDTTTKSWAFSVITDRLNSQVTIQPSEFSDVPNNYYIYIYDVLTTNLHDVRLNGNYSYNSGSGGNRNFLLIVGRFSPNINVPSSINFGNVRIDYDSTRTVQIMNDGLDTLTISSFSITGAYSLSGLTTPLKLAPGANVNTQIKFSPTTLGSNNGTLTLISNDPDNPNAVVNLLGNGIRPTLSKQFTSGWNLIALPLISAAPHKDSVFGSFTNNFQLKQYSNLTGYFNVDTVRMGHGYWLGLMSNINFILTGMPILIDTSFTLNAGWNLIGHVYVRDILRRGLFIKRTMVTPPR